MIAPSTESTRASLSHLSVQPLESLPPNINWLLNGSRLEDLPAYSSRISLSNRSQPMEVETENGTIYSVTRTLTLSNTTDEDSGTYTCEAFNNNARTPTVMQDFELFVRGTDSALYLIMSHSFTVSFYPFSLHPSSC